jgi:hypothetical protein
VTEVLFDNLGLQECTRQWIPHDLTKAQQVEGVRLSRSLLESLRLHKDTEFKGLGTGDESWAYYIDRYQETSMHGSSREEVPLMVRNTIGSSKVMITVFGR